MGTRRKLVVYAGSFDPVTNGHVWMIEQAAMMFDDVVVAIGINPAKKCMFSIDERKELLQKTVCYIREKINHNIEVTSFEGEYLVRYAQSFKFKDLYVLRGIRSVADYEYEKTMRNVNADLAGDVTTVFLMPPRELADISSSSIKGLIGPNGWRDAVKRYVPIPVYDKLIERFGDGK